MTATAKPWTRRGAPGLGGRHRGAETLPANGVRARLAWQELADRVRAACSLADAAADPLTVMHIANLVSRTGSAAPPFENATDREVAAGFRLMVKAWVERHADRRHAMAEALIAAAQLVDGQIHDDRVRAAQSWRGQSGGD